MWSRNLCQIKHQQLPPGHCGTTGGPLAPQIPWKKCSWGWTLTFSHWMQHASGGQRHSTSQLGSPRRQQLGSPGAIVLPVWSLLINWHLESPLESPTACTSWDSSRSKFPTIRGAQLYNFSCVSVLLTYCGTAFALLRSGSAMCPAVAAYFPSSLNEKHLSTNSIQ